ncbi:MAG: TRAP transporter large permease subunit [Deltaproteobacteria bacterium]|nr:TRAP transporter large permease subunit [Deltaproteobacteria bacterium]
MATVGACACFAAISGSSLATAAMFGTIALPEMKKLNYADTLSTGCIAAGGTLGILIDTLSTGCIAAGGTLGILIPPSSVLILYGILTEQSIARLFIAGMIPGICLALIFIVTIYIAVKINPSIGAPGPRFKFKEKVTSIKATWGLIGLFILVIGGLYTGWVRVPLGHL